MRPIIIIRPSLINFELVDTSNIINAILIMFTIVENKMLYPGCVESWVIIIDVEDMEI